MTHNHQVTSDKHKKSPIQEKQKNGARTGILCQHITQLLKLSQQPIAERTQKRTRAQKFPKEKVNWGNTLEAKHQIPSNRNKKTQQKSLTGGRNNRPDSKGRKGKAKTREKGKKKEKKKGEIETVERIEKIEGIKKIPPEFRIRL